VFSPRDAFGLDWRESAMSRDPTVPVRPRVWLLVVSCGAWLGAPVLPGHGSPASGPNREPSLGVRKQSPPSPRAASGAKGGPQCCGPFSSSC